MFALMVETLNFCDAPPKTFVDLRRWVMKGIIVALQWSLIVFEIFTE